MKLLKRIGIGIVSLQVILIFAVIVFEVYGMCMNHAATNRQTERLQAHLINEISDIEIVNVYSETGNLSGTGNHVECLSVVTFSTEMTESKIKKVMEEHYKSQNCTWYIDKTEDGLYSFYQESSAPFPDNIEGH